MVDLDFSDVRGNDAAVAALADAARTRTPVILTGPPGIGKTMIARRAPGLLGPLADREVTWMLAEYDSFGLRIERSHLAEDEVDRDGYTDAQRARPFRAPHHTISAAGMAGAIATRHRIACPEVRGYRDRAGIYHATSPYRCDCAAHGGKERAFRPGECHLARFGVLFLDELQEFGRLVVETIGATVRAMAPDTRPWLIGASCPCPCGWYGSGVRECTCGPATREIWNQRTHRHRQAMRLQPVEIQVRPVSLADLRSATPGISTADLRGAGVAS